MSGEAILLVGHGARDPAWAAPMERLAAALRARGSEVRLAYLEFMAPGIAAALDTLYVGGVRRVRVVPVFLGAGGHVVRDVGSQVATVRALRPDYSVEIEAAVGERVEVVEAMVASIGAGA